MHYRSLLFLCLLLSSCAAGRMVETDLYFGMAKPNGGTVTDTEWNNFKANQVATVFKEGSTIINTTGNWRNPQTGKLITEPTHLIIYLHKPSKALSRQIDSLRNLYKVLFMQQSVLRVDKKVVVSF